ncbi:MAG: DNA/RNA non-specific endonuclease [Methylococcales bacterium]|nr:DNA/RNA non-specific endonuclease [Methylococcales bacterium]
MKSERFKKLEEYSTYSVCKSTIEYIIGILLDDYYENINLATPEIVETTQTKFSYLFDITHQRLIAAWGFSKGKNTEPRDKIRVDRKWKPGGDLKNDNGRPLYEKGHAIAHSLGGGADINFVAQLAALNKGAFKVLENKAMTNPDSFYFVYWEYPNVETQVPSNVVQGLIYPSGHGSIKQFAN